MTFSMHDLERELALALPVAPLRIDALVAGVSARALEEPVARLTRRGTWIAALAAASVLALAILRPWSNEADHAATATLDSATWQFTLARSSELGTYSYSEPPGLGGVLPQSDVALVARVLSVDQAAVRLQVEEVLFGEALLAESGLSIHSEPRGWSCTDELRWEAGERCLLLLTRDEKSGRLRVTFDGSGKLALPLTPYLDLDQIKQALNERVYPVNGIAQAMREGGPKVLRTAIWHLGYLPGARAIPDDPAIQSVLRDWLFDRSQPEEERRENFFTVVHYLHADAFQGLPESLDAWLQRTYIDVLNSEPNGRFNAFDVLRPLCRARVPWAQAALREHLDRVASPGAAKVAYSYILGGIEDLARFAPSEARARLWTLYDAIPERERRDRRSALELALNHGLDGERAEREVLRMIDERLEIGFGLPIRELLLCTSETAQLRLRGLFAAKSATPALDSTWERAVHDAGEAGDQTALAALVPDWLREEVERHLRREERSVYEFVDWLRLRRSYNNDPTALRMQLEKLLLRESLQSAERRALVEELREWFDVGPTWRELTEPEVQALAVRIGELMGE